MQGLRVWSSVLKDFGRGGGGEFVTPALELEEVSAVQLSRPLLGSWLGNPSCNLFRGFYQGLHKGCTRFYKGDVACAARRLCPATCTRVSFFFGL